MSDPLLNQLIAGRYRLTRCIGSGAMGQVFEATDTHLFDRRVAIKILRQSLSGEEFLRRRFQAEARISALLGEHPLIIRVLDHGLFEDRPYIVMEYLGAPPFAGQPLNEIIKQGELDIKRVVRLVRQICTALQYAHSFTLEQKVAEFSIKGVIHRDIKPSNIFVIKDPTLGETIKLLDFGIAKTLTDVTLSLGTQMMGFVGTPAYASPEQLRGETLDHRSDIYSLGILTYQTLAGEFPLVPKTDSFPGWYEAQNYQQPRPLPPHIPTGLAAVIMSCLAKEPDQRPASMELLKEQLKVAIQGVVLPQVIKPQAVPTTTTVFNLNRIARPLEVALVDFNVSPQFRGRDRELHILLEYPAHITLNRSELLKVIVAKVMPRHGEGLDQVVVYGRRFRQPKPDWQETLNLGELAKSYPETPPPSGAHLILTASSMVGTLVGSVTYDPAIRNYTTVDVVDQGSQAQAPDPATTQFGRMQRRAFLLPLPLLTERMAQIRAWSLDYSDSLVPVVLSMELKGSIVDRDPGVMMHYLEGVNHLQQGDWKGAFDQFQSALHDDPKLAEARIYLGVVFLQRQDLDRAFLQFQAALKLNEALAEAHTCMGYILLHRKELDQAIAAFQYALQLNNSLTEAHIYLLKALIQRGFLGEAIDHFQHALPQAPQLIGIRLYMVQVMLLQSSFLLQSGDPEGAVNTLKRAVLLQAEDAVLHCYLGLSLVASSVRGHWQEAITEFRIATKLDPLMIEGHVGMGIALNKSDNLNAAVTAYRTALDLNGNSLSARYNLGIVLWRRGELQSALQEFRTVLGFEPTFAEGTISLGMALLQAGDIEAALQAFEGALTLDPNLAEAYCGLGGVYLQKMQLQTAIEKFRHALELYPKLAAAHAGIGLVYLEQNQVAAQEMFTLALKISADVPEAHYGLGELERRQQSFTLAARHYRAALSINRSYTDAHYKLALVLSEQGKRDEAIGEARLALQLNSQHSGVQKVLDIWLKEQWQHKISSVEP